MVTSTIGGPTAEWEEGECRRQGIDTSVFFYEDQYPRSSYRYREAREAARRICDACCIREECAEFAISTGQEGGMWGGLTDSERRQIRKKRFRLSQLQLQVPTWAREHERT